MFDPDSRTRHLFPDDLSARYSFKSYRGAAIQLCQNCPNEFDMLVRTLRGFRIRAIDICRPGGSKSRGTIRFGRLAQRNGFSSEVSLGAEFHWTLRTAGQELLTWKNREFIHGHKIDHWSSLVALDYEWNSKDQTYDRDLLAVRQFYDLGIINLAVIVTRDLSPELTSFLPSLEHYDPAKTYSAQQRPTRFRHRGEEFIQKESKGELRTVISKMGASTTGLPKLASRLMAGRGGACPILIVGVTDGCVV